MQNDTQIHKILGKIGKNEANFIVCGRILGRFMAGMGVGKSWLWKIFLFFVKIFSGIWKSWGKRGEYWD